MERSPICVTCLSKYPDIRGLVYTPGMTVGLQCGDTWHLGAEHNPDRWVLSAFDTEMLAELHISER